MRVLIAAPTYLPARRANTIQVMKMAQAIVELDHDVCVLVPDSKRGKAAAWDEIALQYGLRSKFEIKWLPVHPRLRSYDYGFKVIRHYKAWGADILYTRSPQAAAFASSIGIPTVFEIHDLPGGFMGPRLTRKFLNGKGARRFVVITQSLRDAVHREVSPLPAAPFTVITPDGVDIARYEAVPDPGDARRLLKKEWIPELPISQFTAGYTGHFYTGRGVELILTLASRLPDLTFLLVGGDSEAVMRFKEKVKVRSLRNIIITGFVPNAELPVFQAACEVLLMPYQQSVAASSGGDISQYLSPMKMFEYLACGRVILSSDLPVFREVLNDKNAIILPPDDADIWVEALTDIKDDLSRRQFLMEQARKDAKLYTWESRAAHILSDVG